VASALSIAFPREMRSGMKIDDLIYRCGGSDGIAALRRTVFPIKCAPGIGVHHLSKSNQIVPD
jgi:hypothetical protein